MCVRVRENSTMQLMVMTNAKKEQQRTQEQGWHVCMYLNERESESGECQHRAIEGVRANKKSLSDECGKWGVDDDQLIDQ